MHVQPPASGVAHHGVCASPAKGGEGKRSRPEGGAIKQNVRQQPQQWSRLSGKPLIVFECLFLGHGISCVPPFCALCKAKH
jgi:hypothetical protein